MKYVYLVTLSHGMDDVPIRLFDDRDEAFAFAETMWWDVPDDLSQRLELPDCDTPAVISITTFGDGVPISHVIVREAIDEGMA